MASGSAAVDLDELTTRFDLDADSVGDLARRCRDRLEAEVAEIVELREAGGHPVPDLTFDEVRARSDEHRALVRRRGCLIVRRTFEPAEVLEWEAELADYLRRNGVDEYADGSGIRPIYWSVPQIAARQHPRMVAVRRALNAIWTDPGDTSVIDPEHDIGYADRIRRRPPGITARGLRLHCDSPAAGGWRIAENHDVFRHVLAGQPERHDPWDPSYRTADLGSPAAPSRVFRTFQGWTALGEIHPDDGVLTLVPTLRAVEHLLVAGLAQELGSFGESRPAPQRIVADELVAAAATPIPAVGPGDTVWWHGDLVHGVEDAANDTRWSNVMYIPASPRCPRNDTYAATLVDRFDAGRSPIDFPNDHLEVDFVGRATRDDLDEVGRQQFGLAPVPTRRPGVRTPADGSIGSDATPI